MDTKRSIVLDLDILLDILLLPAPASLPSLLLLSHPPPPPFRFESNKISISIPLHPFCFISISPLLRTHIKTQDLKRLKSREPQPKLYNYTP